MSFILICLECNATFRCTNLIRDVSRRHKLRRGEADDVLTGETRRVDGRSLGAVVSLVDPDQRVGQLKHVGAKRNDDKLSVFRAFLPNKRCTVKLRHQHGLELP